MRNVELKLFLVNASVTKNCLKLPKEPLTLVAHEARSFRPQAHVPVVGNQNTIPEHSGSLFIKDIGILLVDCSIQAFQHPFACLIVLIDDVQYSQIHIAHPIGIVLEFSSFIDIARN